MQLNSIHHRTRIWTGLTVLLLSLSGILLSACDDTLSPIIESDRQATLWGTLDMNSDVQRLRVVPIREVLNPGTAEKMEMDLRSVDLGTGETVVWSGSVITFSDGKVGVIFEVELKLEPEHTYRIELRSPSFRLVTSAETTMPAIPVATIEEEEVSRSTSPQSGFVIRGVQDIFWNQLNQKPYDVQTWYRFLEFIDVGFVDIVVPYEVPNFYDDALKELEVKMDLKRQRDSLDSEIDLNSVLLVGLGQTITVLDDNFAPPGGVFDPEILAQPGTMSNVENGFGFVGTVGRFSIEWVIADESARILSYSPLNGERKTGIQGGPGRRPVSIAASPWSDE